MSTSEKPIAETPNINNISGNINIFQKHCQNTIFNLTKASRKLRNEVTHGLDDLQERETLASVLDPSNEKLITVDLFLKILNLLRKVRVLCIVHIDANSDFSKTFLRLLDSTDEDVLFTEWRAYEVSLLEREVSS